jgi:hypothetical protein
MLQETLARRQGPDGEGDTDGADGQNGADGEQLRERVQKALERGSAAEREVVLAARAIGEVTPAAADEVLDDIEARAARTL